MTMKICVTRPGKREPVLTRSNRILRSFPDCFVRSPPETIDTTGRRERYLCVGTDLVTPATRRAHTCPAVCRMFACSRRNRSRTFCRQIPTDTSPRQCPQSFYRSGLSPPASVGDTQRPAGSLSSTLPSRLLDADEISCTWNVRKWEPLQAPGLYGLCGAEGQRRRESRSRSVRRHQI